MLPFSHSLAVVVAALVAGRMVASAAYLWACLRTFPELRRSFRIRRASLGPLLRFGSWMTVSNVVGLLMVTFDRFIIGAMISLSAVAYYAIPYEVVTRLSLLPVAIVGVLFPAFSTAHATDSGRVARLFASGTRYIFILLFPFTLILVAFAPEACRFGWEATSPDTAPPSSGYWLWRCLSMVWAMFLLRTSRPWEGPYHSQIAPCGTPVLCGSVIFPDPSNGDPRRRHRMAGSGNRGCYSSLYVFPQTFT